MSRIAQKARKRANRSLKRREVHKEHMIEVLSKAPEDEQLSRRNMYGNLDLTAYCGMFNVMNPDRKPRYGI